mmetsp:Transcript_3138/g.3532  ORF Transcript_3138/g.3532 Transcript_3138/m.3532 type:complete len:125 (-) Transcript_3138:98-472(-)
MCHFSRKSKKRIKNSKKYQYIRFLFLVCGNKNGFKKLGSIEVISNSIRFNSIRLNSIRFVSIRFNSIQFTTIRFIWVNHFFLYLYQHCRCHHHCHYCSATILASTKREDTKCIILYNAIHHLFL